MTLYNERSTAVVTHSNDSVDAGIQVVAHSNDSVDAGIQVVAHSNNSAASCHFCRELLSHYSRFKQRYSYESTIIK